MVAKDRKLFKRSLRRAQSSRGTGRNAESPGDCVFQTPAYNSHMEDKKLVIVPLFNEEKTIVPVLKELRRSYGGDVLVVDDGSTDNSSARVKECTDCSVELFKHDLNVGYGAALISGFTYALENGYQKIVTMDCDWQHEPALVADFFKALDSSDVVSGSRYLQDVDVRGETPVERREVNKLITAEIRERLKLEITDAFCGFKGYRAEVLRALELSEVGYAFPLQVWAQIAREGFSVSELAVPRVYLDHTRSFGQEIDDPQVRLKYYREVLNRSIHDLKDSPMASSRSA